MIALLPTGARSTLLERPVIAAAKLVTFPVIAPRLKLTATVLYPPQPFSLLFPHLLLLKPPPVPMSYAIAIELA